MSFCSISRQKNFEIFLSSFQSYTLFEEFTSGESSKEMHVHRSGEETKKILSYTKTCRHLKLKEALQDSLITHKGSLRQFDPNRSPYFTINSTSTTKFVY